MASVHLLPFFLTGLLGSAHCVGMCGGIVGALSLVPGRRVVPIHAAALADGGTELLRSDTLMTLNYNLGRIGSYALAGGLAGWLAAGLAALPGLQVVQRYSYALSNLMLVAVGLYLAGIWPQFAALENIGRGIWRRLQPLGRLLLPLDRPSKAFLMGGLWGWLPCGMVYSNLLIASLSGTATSGALVMLAFGAGTLPALFAAGMIGVKLKEFLQRPAVRRAAGMTVLSFGGLGLLRVYDGSLAGWLAAVCITRGGQ